MANPTSYAQFLSNVTNLSVTGVTRALTEPPQRLAPADMPISFPRLVGGTEGPLTAGSTAGGWPTLRCELVVILEPYMLDNNAPNHTATLTMIDNLNQAIRGADFAMGPHRWVVRMEVIDVGNVSYWAAICEIETTG